MQRIKVKHLMPGDVLEVYIAGWDVVLECHPTREHNGKYHVRIHPTKCQDGGFPENLIWDGEWEVDLIHRPSQIGEGE